MVNRDLNEGTRRLAIDLSIVAVFTLVTHGLLLFHDMPVWDDWVLIPRYAMGDWAVITRWGWEGGVVPFGYFHVLIGHFPDPILAYKVVSLLAIVLSACFTYLLLSGLPVFQRFDLIVVGLMTATFPVFIAQTSGMVTTYLCAYAVFLAAALAYRASRKRSSIPLRTLSLVAFYLSFTLQSLLVFYAAFLAYAVVLGNVDSDSWRRRVSAFARSHVDYLALPVVFWVVKQLFFVPYGDYAGYNSLKLNPVDFLSVWVPLLYGALVVPSSRLLDAFVWSPWIAIAFVFVLSFLKPLFRPADDRVTGPMALLGVLLILLALFPYAAVGKFATDYDPWSNRFNQLTPVGLTLVFLFGSQWYRRWVALPHGFVFWSIVGVIALSSTAQLMTYSAFGIDALKQQAMVLQLRDHNAELADVATVTVIDSSTSHNAFEREFRFYEYSGMLTTVLGRTGTLGVSEERVTDPIYMKDISRWFGDDLYLLDGYHPDGPRKRIIITTTLAPAERTFSLFLSSAFLRLTGRTEEHADLARRNFKLRVE